MSETTHTEPGRSDPTGSVWPFPRNFASDVDHRPCLTDSKQMQLPKLEIKLMVLRALLLLAAHHSMLHPAAATLCMPCRRTKAAVAALALKGVRENVGFRLTAIPARYSLPISFA